MNAKERKRLIGAIETYLPLEYREPIIRALRLLAAAERNDGSTPETDACADWNARCERVDDNEVITHGLMLALAHDEGDELRLLSSRLERELDGLAARVGELEKDAERYRWLVDSPLTDAGEFGIYNAYSSGTTFFGDKEHADAAIDAALKEPQ